MSQCSWEEEKWPFSLPCDDATKVEWRAVVVVKSGWAEISWELMRIFRLACPTYSDSRIMPRCVLDPPTTHSL
jgi:hypothetical protein